MLKYGPTTIVDSQKVIQRERRLPTHGDLIGTLGQEVTPNQVVGRSQQSKGYCLINAAEHLHVSADNVEPYLQVAPGDLVDVGMVLGRKRPFRKVVSPIEGRVYGVYNGQIVLERPFIWHELRALLRGRIINQTPSQSVLIETRGTLIQARWGSGKEGFGRLKVLNDDRAGELAVQHLSKQLTRHIIVGGTLTDPQILEQAANLEIAGLIVGSALAALYSQMLAARFPIVVTDSFGKQGMAAPIFDLLQTLENRETTIFAHHEDKKRPEIIIAASGLQNGHHKIQTTPLTVGQTVRLIRKPYEQQIGQIIKLYDQTQALETGLYAPGAAVRLANGSVVFVPDANLDVIHL